MSDAAAPAIELLGVSKAFASPGAGLLAAAGPPVHALRDVELTIARGEALGIAGPNGAGKTTLLKLVAALIHPTRGQVRVDGLDTVKDGDRLRPRVGFVPAQERTLYGRLTLRQNLHFFAAIKGLDRAATARRVDELADRVGLLQALDRRANAVSSGFLQRCAIARALLAEPDVLLMDEPTRSLDEATAASVRAFVRDDHVRRLGRTLLVATHQVRDLGEMCDRVVEIEGGRLVGGSDSPAGHASKRVTESVRVVALDPAARAWPADAPLGIAGLRSRILPAGEIEFTHAQRMGDAKLHELLTALLGAGMKVVTVETRRDLPASGVGEARKP